MNLSQLIIFILVVCLIFTQTTAQADCDDQAQAASAATTAAAAQQRVLNRMDREQKRFRANSAYNYKEQFFEVDSNKENLIDINAQSEETSYRNRVYNSKPSSVSQQLQHHHLMNNSYKNLPKQIQSVQSVTSGFQLSGNQISDLYDKLKTDYTKLMIDYQKEQMECNNLRSQNKLDSKKLNELDKIVAEQQQEIVTLNNEIQLQLSQNHVLREYMKEQEDRVTKMTAENTTLTQELSSTRPTTLKNKSYTSITQHNETKYEQFLENKDYLERQIDQLQQQNSKLQHSIKELHEQMNHVKMQYITLENHSQMVQRSLKQLELESSQDKINESLLKKNYQKLEEDYKEMQNMNLNLQDHNKQLSILITKLEDKIKIMEEQCNNTLFWEQTAKEFELQSLKMQEESMQSCNNFKDMENYVQAMKSQFKEEKERLVNDIKSYKKEVQLHREKNDMLNKNVQQFQKEYQNLKNQQKGYQNQNELIKNLKDTLVSIESSLSRETRLNEEKITQIKGLEIQVDELKKQNIEKQERILKMEEQIADLNSRQQHLLDISHIQREQGNNSLGSANLNETQLNYNSCNSNANNNNHKVINNGGGGANQQQQQFDPQLEMQDKVHRLEQTIFELKNQMTNQNQGSHQYSSTPQQYQQQSQPYLQMQQSQPQQQENSSFQQSYNLPYTNPKNISINNSPLHKTFLSSQYNSNPNHNIHSYHNSSFNHSRPTIDIERNQSHNNSFHFRKNSNDGSSFLGIHTNKNKSSQMENLQRKYEEIKNRSIKNNN